MTEAEIRNLFGKFNAELFRSDVWNVQNATVIKHSALERLAAAAGIKFDAPSIIRAERDEAVILAVGHLGDRSEWSIGEALINMNYRVSGKQAGYVYAMAEKRAKDRVIIKLANLHGLYSEDEADEFKENTNPAPMRERAATVSSGTNPAHNGTVASLSPTAKLMLKAAEMAMTKQDVTDWVRANGEAIDGLPEGEPEKVRDHARALYSRLPEKVAA